MYENLVAWLRDKDFEPICPCGDESICQGKDCAVLQAADAIEELSRELDSVNELVTALDGAIPRWIPVTEWLPKTGEYVLVRFKNNDMAVACIFERDENFTFWRAMTDEEWCVDCDTEPSHWMPLPEPPEGGADG